jgi:hypothetical protein
MSIDDLMAFATGAQFVIHANKMLTIDAALHQRTGLPIGEVAGGRRVPPGGRRPHPICFTEYYINRAFASVGRILQRHNGPIFPLIEDMFGRTVVGGAPGNHRRRHARRPGRSAERGARYARTRGPPDLHDLRRRDRPGHHQHPPGEPVPALDDDAADQGMTAPLPARSPTRCDAASERTDHRRRHPARRRDPAERAAALARTLLTRMPVGSVVSFMLPNWHEAAVVYLGATLAGMAVNPILPSLRDRELSFILDDVDSRIIFVPGEFRGHDYAGMLTRVVADLPDPPEVVVVRGPGHTPYTSLFAPAATLALPELEPADVRMIMYTSGTTGRPKGVLHSHNSLHALIGQLRDNWHIEPADRFLVPSPSRTSGFPLCLQCPLLLGTTAVLMEQWEPDDAVSLMTAQRCTHMAAPHRS